MNIWKFSLVSKTDISKTALKYPEKQFFQSLDTNNFHDGCMKNMFTKNTVLSVFYYL